MRRVVRTAAALALAAAVGCGATGPVPVEGTVRVNGEPMKVGTITLVAADGSHQHSGTVRDGQVDIPRAQGPTPGAYRVQIHWDKPTGKVFKNPDSGAESPEYAEGLPEKYHAQTELTTEVTGSPHRVEFDLTVGTGKAPAK